MQTGCQEIDEHPNPRFERNAANSETARTTPGDGVDPTRLAPLPLTYFSLCHQATVTYSV
jgi:hypothetical protein